ncbi:MAG: hypothetical protein H0U28_00505 [Nocardioidaceae bacterium]|nr:hypothetical protein [Nocardioidaceae bacterium]
MGILSKIAKAGVAKKAIDAAKRPENQRKAKSAMSSVQKRRRGRRT